MAIKKLKANGHIVQPDWNQTDPKKFDYIHNKPDISDVIKSSAQNLTTAQKAQARANIGAATPSEITTQVTTLSNQLYDTNYGTESGMSIRYIAGQVINDKAVSLAKGTRKNDLNFTYTNGAWNINPAGNYYGEVETALVVNGISIYNWVLKGIELANDKYKQTLISNSFEFTRVSQTNHTWTNWQTITSQEYVDAALNNKLTKSSATGLYRAYGINDKGEQTTWTVQSSINTTGATGYIARYMSKDSFGNTKPTYDNATLITGDPNKPYHVANKNYIDTNFIKTTADLQTITGSLTITGDLTIKGTTKTQDAQTQLIEENIIELNSGKVLNEIQLSGVVINKDNTSAYGIVYDPKSDAVKLGLGETNNGEFSFNSNEGTPIATREEYNKDWKDDAIFVFDKETKKFKYSGKTLASFEEEIMTKMRAEMDIFVKDYVETYMSDIEIEHDDGTTEKISKMIFANDYEEKQNGTELWIKEN